MYKYTYKFIQYVGINAREVGAAQPVLDPRNLGIVIEKEKESENEIGRKIGTESETSI